MPHFEKLSKVRRGRFKSWQYVREFSHHIHPRLCFDYPAACHMISILRSNEPWYRLPYSRQIAHLRRFSIISRRYHQPNSLNYPAPSAIIVSGIQPTGTPHLGNYLGALRPWLQLQNESSPATKLFFSIADLHAITVPQNRDRLRLWKRETLTSLLALGLNPQRCVIFHQSHVSLLTFVVPFTHRTDSLAFQH